MNSADRFYAVKLIKAARFAAAYACLVVLLAACTSPQPAAPALPATTPGSSPSPAPPKAAALPASPTARVSQTHTSPPQPSAAHTSLPSPIASIRPFHTPVPVDLAEPVHIGDVQFPEVVLESPLPVVVDFWAPWCAPCKVIAPILDDLAREYAGRLRIVHINTDEYPLNAQIYNVIGIPTMLFFHQGKLIHRQIGALPEEMLRQVVIQFLEAVQATRTPTLAKP